MLISSGVPRRYLQTMLLHLLLRSTLTIEKGHRHFFSVQRTSGWGGIGSIGRLQHTTAQRCRSETEKNILDDILSSILSKLKKYHPSGNLNFNNLGIFQSLKSSNLKGKILRISLKLNFSPNNLSCYGLSLVRNHRFEMPYWSDRLEWDR